ncbi:PREDICTED: pentatricopeptide repeat-containing protein At3g60050-like [Tarenaya hassleriana]|uniref:pentatricopeptide repeat-containing protein At3g60050-like n=1 Tax=Tarenaya hassleriana TaxID=28532 RepID=UPI00053CA85C|nr:PREDICTED: pentatricopeptide repeat-containing protein At3g60050-like [Tarenaya hassleriana]XP_010542483.1 PREDICTED: pentatricopeptide repeat-containing protein At3g60050-like [Tarenaya hassleriana]
MYLAVPFGRSVARKVCRFFFVSRKLCDGSFGGEETDNGFHHIEEPLNRTWEVLDSDDVFNEKLDMPEHEGGARRDFSVRRSFLERARLDASRVLEILLQDEPGFNTKSALDELSVRVSAFLVRQVLLGILRAISYDSKTRRAKLAYKFIIWSGQQENFRHTANSYHLLMKVFAECGEYKAMWRLVDEMNSEGYPTTAQTFNILICTCGEAGIARKVVDRFIKSKNFNFRPYRHSYNAILHSLLVIKQYRLIVWVYQQMLADGFSPDVLTYNILMCANYRLGKLDRFYRLFEEMGREGFCPDLHTYNILLHFYGKRDKPLAALELLRHMREVGMSPSMLHFTTLIDGLSRAGNLEACKYFFDEMVKTGFIPDVVCYTVMITGYIMAGEFEKAQELFNEMTLKGQLPNVFTYNSMIRGFCMAKKFKEALAMFKEMKSRGCEPNFVVYRTLVSYLRDAGMLSEAREVIRDMVEKGQYVHLVSKIRKYRRYD